MKTILIATPENKYISPQTMQSIYNLKLPDDYCKHIEFFYGYKPTQVLNLVSDWGKRYHAVLFLTAQSEFSSEDINTMLSKDKPVVVRDLTLDCALVKGEVFSAITYPHFSGTDYQQSFFKKIAEKFEIYQLPHTQDQASIQQQIHEVFLRDLLPKNHVLYLKSMEIAPKIIYDIGSAVLHWTRHAKKTWPKSTVFLFDATEEVEFLYEAVGHNYHIGVLTDCDHKQVEFYNDPTNIGGNSYYKENTAHYDNVKSRSMVGMTLDTVVETNNYPLPDMMKLDVQGAEIDVLRGAQRCLQHCCDVILEAQHVDYNRGAPKVDEVIDFMTSIGYELVNTITKNSIDGDYHFKRI